MASLFEVLDIIEGQASPRPGSNLDRAIQFRFTGSATRQTPTATEQRLDEIERERALREILARARKKSPETFSEAVDLSQKTGLPSGDIEDHTKTIRDRIDDTPVKLSRHSPITAQALIDDPDLAGAAHDSIRDLTGLEWLWTAPRAAFGQGESQRELNIIRYAQIFDGASDADLIRADQLSASMSVDLGAEGWWENAAVEFPKMLPISLGVLAEGVKGGLAGSIGGSLAGFLSGPSAPIAVPALALSGFYVGSRPGAMREAARQEAGGAYNEFLGVRDEDGQPLDENVAKGAALIAGGMNGVLEIAGLSVVLRQFPGGDKFLSMGIRTAIRKGLKTRRVRDIFKNFALRYVKAGAAETGVEITEEVVTTAAGELAKMASEGDFKGITKEEFADRLVEVAVKTAQAMTFMAAGGAGVSVVSDATKVRQAKYNQQTMIALGETAKASKLRERLPLKYLDFVQRVRAEGPVTDIYISPEALMEVIGNPDNLKDTAPILNAVPGLRAAIAEAIADKTDVKIALEDYATYIAPTELHQVLIPNTKFQRDGITLTQAQDLEALFDEQDALAEEEATRAAGLESAAELAGVTAEDHQALRDANKRFDAAKKDQAAAETARKRAEEDGLSGEELASLDSAVKEARLAAAEANEVLTSAMQPAVDLLRTRLTENVEEFIEVVAEERNAAEQTKSAVRDIVDRFLAGEDVDITRVIKEGPSDVGTFLADVINKVATKEDITQKVVSGRITTLQRDLRNIDTRIADKSETLDTREKAGRSTRRLQGQIDRLAEKADALEAEIVKLEAPAVKAGLLPEFEGVGKEASVAKKEGTHRGQTLSALNVKITSESVAATRRAFAAGLRAARKGTKEVQTILTQLVRNSGLSDNAKISFLATIKNVQTVEQFEKQLPGIRSRIINALEEERKEQLSKALKVRLGKTRTRKSGGKVVGKYTPEIQKTLDRLRGAYKLTEEEARARVEATLAVLANNQDISDIDALENAVLLAAHKPDSIDSDFLETLVLSVDEIMEEGRAISKWNHLLRTQEANLLREEVVRQIGEVTRPLTRREESLIYAEVFVFLGWSGAWWNKLSRIFKSSNKEATDALIKRLSLFGESRVFERNRIDSVNKFERLARRALGGVTKRQLLKKLRKDSTERVRVGKFTLSEHQDPEHEHFGRVREVTIEMTRSQLRKRYMELQNEALRKLAMHPDSNAYTEAIIAAIKENLSDEDLRLVDAQIEFYDEFYDRINAVYERMYGVSLPKEDVFSPIKREMGEDQVDEFLLSTHYLNGVSPGSLKARVPSHRELLPLSDVDTLHSHIMEMEYFIAYAEKVRLLRSVFGGQNAKVSGMIRKAYGSRMLRTINSDLDYFARKGALSAAADESVYLTLMRNFGIAQLGLKPQIGLKQLASTFAFAEDIPPVDFVTGLMEFAKNPRKALLILNESQYFRERGINIDKDYQDLTSDRSFLNFVGNRPTLTQAMMIFIKYGDKAAIAMGGYSHYRAMRKKGKTHKQALESFELISSRTQQATDPDQLSEAQRANAFIRITAQFMSSANALARASYNAIVDFKRGRITPGEFAKRFVIYHWIIPNVIQVVANGFEWDDEDQLRASLIGSFNGVFIFGDLVEAGLNRWLGAPQQGLEIRHPLKFWTLIFNALTDYEKFDITLEEFIEGSNHISRFLRGTGDLSGIGLRTLYNEMTGISRAADDPVAGTKLMLGWSPYTVGREFGDSVIPGIVGGAVEYAGEVIEGVRRVGRELLAGDPPEDLEMPEGFEFLGMEDGKAVVRNVDNPDFPIGAEFFIGAESPQDE